MIFSRNVAQSGPCIVKSNYLFKKCYVFSCNVVGKVEAVAG